MSGSFDQAMMRRAIDLARVRLGKTRPNPSVGCVLVKDGQVLAEAATGLGGRPHAEEQALDLATADVRGATAYVTLEPCGCRSTGAKSCSERLIEAGVTRVVMACDNPDRLSAGHGVERLMRAGVEVSAGLLADEAGKTLYRGFLHRLDTGLPLVEEAESGEGFDAEFLPGPSEGLNDALKRYGDDGYARLWTPRGGVLARRLDRRQADLSE